LFRLFSAFTPFAPTSQLRHGASWRQNKVKTGGGQYKLICSLNYWY